MANGRQIAAVVGRLSSITYRLCTIIVLTRCGLRVAGWRPALMGYAQRNQSVSILADVVKCWPVVRLRVGRLSVAL
jgi:hypothetical protein